MDEQAPYTVCDPDDHVGLFLHLSYLVCICKNLSKGYIVYPVFYLYILFFFDLLIDHKRLLSKKRKLVQFIVLSILLCLVRHNGFYVAVVTMVGLIIFCKGNRKKCTVLLIGLVAFWQIYNAVLPRVGIIPGGKQEMLSIPFQQTARYVKEHGKEVTKEEKMTINKVLI